MNSFLESILLSVKIVPLAGKIKPFNVAVQVLGICPKARHVII